MLSTKPEDTLDYENEVYGDSSDDDSVSSCECINNCEYIELREGLHEEIHRLQGVIQSVGNIIDTCEPCPLADKIRCAISFSGAYCTCSAEKKVKLLEKEQKAKEIRQNRKD